MRGEHEDPSRDHRDDHLEIEALVRERVGIAQCLEPVQQEHEGRGAADGPDEQPQQQRAQVRGSRSAAS